MESTASLDRRVARGRVRALATNQHGVFTTTQARHAGMDPRALRNWARTGEVESVRARVWVVTGAARTDRQSAMTALLTHGHGAALALDSAAALWGFQGFRLLPAHVVRIRHGHRRTGDGGHSSTRYHDGHVALMDGLRITTVGRMLFDFAGRLHPGRVERLTDTAISRRLTTMTALTTMLAELQGRGRPGIQLMRSLLEARSDPTFQPTDSNLEARFEQLVRDAGLTGFVRQRLIGDAHGIIGRVDYVEPTLFVIVEIQSQIYHRSLLDQARDSVRLERLRADGWRVVEVDEADIWHRPAAMLARLKAALSEARRHR